MTVVKFPTRKTSQEEFMELFEAFVIEVREGKWKHIIFIADCEDDYILLNNPMSPLEAVGFIEEAKLRMLNS